MFKIKAFLWGTVGILLSQPGIAFSLQQSTGISIRGTAPVDAIDTLTVTDNGLSGELLGVPGKGKNGIKIQFGRTDSGKVRDDYVINGEHNSAFCKFFSIRAVGVDSMQVDADSGLLIVSVELISNGMTQAILPGGPPVVSASTGLSYTRFDIGLQPARNHPTCKNEKKVPSLSLYGLIVLALLLAGTAVWLFRRRLAVEKGGVA